MQLLLPHLAGVAIEKVEEVGGVMYVRPGGGGGLRTLWVRRGQGAQPIRALPGRRAGGRTAVGDPAAGTAVVLRRTVLWGQHFRGTGRGGEGAARAANTTAAGDAGGSAVALAGRAGARLASAPHASASRSTLLRLLAVLPDPAAVTPRMVGVDDFALRRGQNYGTVLIDCETGAPLELLPGRDAQTLANWLAAHPGVEVVCPDRSGSYAEGARLGAPDAMQVADRFHLWQNMGKAVERCVARHRDCLRATEPQPTDQLSLRPQDEEPGGRFAQRARRHHEKVHDLLASGHSIRGIARGLGWGQRTVQRYAHAATWQELVDGKCKGARPSKLDPFKPYLHQRWNPAVATPYSSTVRSRGPRQSHQEDQKADVRPGRTSTATQNACSSPPRDDDVRPGGLLNSCPARGLLPQARKGPRRGSLLHVLEPRRWEHRFPDDGRVPA